MYNWLTIENIDFPSFDTVSEEGILALGGDLSIDRIIKAYQIGAFPWYSKDQPIIWWAPDPRFILFPDKIKISKSMRNVFNQNKFYITENKAFLEVITNCRKTKRKGQDEDGAWLHQEMIDAYCILHEKGIAKSIEVWNKNNELVGGFYGMDMGSVFCGESMFAKESNASKFGFISFVNKYKNTYQLIDCQYHSEHLESLGAEHIPRDQFIAYLNSK